MSTAAPDCVFCKIVAGDIPAEVLGRNGEAIAFRDLNPQAPFHVLVAPLAHHENAAASAAADPASLGHVVALADEVAQEAGADVGSALGTDSATGRIGRWILVAVCAAVVAVCILALTRIGSGQSEGGAGAIVLVVLLGTLAGTVGVLSLRRPKGRSRGR